MLILNLVISYVGRSAALVEQHSEDDKTMLVSSIQGCLFQWQMRVTCKGMKEDNVKMDGVCDATSGLDNDEWGGGKRW